jgi:hypothetical protein
LPVSNSYAIRVHTFGPGRFESALEMVECPMRSISLFVSVLVSHIRQISDAMGASWEIRRYRPERHYMRGPGPKWREKHFHSV